MPNVSALQRGLVEELKRRNCIRTAAVEAAFRAVPRHLFVPGVPLADVYRDVAIPTKRDADGGSDITPAWREQLRPAGRLLLPLSIKGPQMCVAFERANAHLASVSIRAVIPDLFQWPETSTVKGAHTVGVIGDQACASSSGGHHAKACTSGRIPERPDTIRRPAK